MAKDKQKQNDPLAQAGNVAPDHTDTSDDLGLGQGSTELTADGTPMGGNPATSSSLEQPNAAPTMPEEPPTTTGVGVSQPARAVQEYTVARAITLSWGDQMLRLAPGDVISAGSHGPDAVVKMRQAGVAFLEDMVAPADVPRATTAPNVVPVPEDEARQLRPSGDVGPSATIPAALTGEAKTFTADSQQKTAETEKSTS